MNMVSMEISIEAVSALWTEQRLGESPSDTILRILKSPDQITPERFQESKIAVRTDSNFRFAVLGIEKQSASAKDAYFDVLRSLHGLDETIIEKLAVLAAGSSRNHFAKTPEDVYPKRPDLIGSVVELVPGWYTGKNISNAEKRKFLRYACKILKLEYGTDIVF